MGQRSAGSWRMLCAAVVLALGSARAAYGVALDEKGEITLGVRAYTAARIGSQDTNITLGNAFNTQVYRNLTFPVSAAGHLRQSRYFVEAELNHDVNRLLREGLGPLALLNDLPFKIRRLSYHLTYRGEYEGIYDYGPREYSTATQYFDPALVPPFSGKQADVMAARRRLRNVAVLRNRLFQAYIQAEAGDLFLRFGRQILVWGETDAFRLLDNINPIDNGFGGFLIPLDERRVPLDMLLANYYIGDIGPFSGVFVEAFGAIDDAVGYDPGVPEGSAWALPNLGEPSASTTQDRIPPTRRINSIRGGVQLKFNAPLPWVEEGTFGIAHYYTYFDTPEVQTFVNGGQDGRFFPLAIQNGPGATFQALAEETAPRVQVTGATATFAVPAEASRALFLSGEPIIRAELAYFKGEPRHSQRQLDPFVWGLGQCSSGPDYGYLSASINPNNQLCSGGRRTGDSWNFVLGIDTNQWFRMLNPRQTFFLSTQFFYKHLNGAVKREPIPGLNDPLLNQAVVFDGEVLPVPAYRQTPSNAGPVEALEPIFVHNPVDQFLQTLLISTSYYSGQVNPSLTLFYDWSGAFVALPQVQFSRDPFRFIVGYSYLTAGRLKGASGVSLLRDRDNFLFQFEYVL